MDDDQAIDLPLSFDGAVEVGSEKTSSAYPSDGVPHCAELAHLCGSLLCPGCARPHYCDRTCGFAPQAEDDTASARPCVNVLNDTACVDMAEAGLCGSALCPTCASAGLCDRACGLCPPAARAKESAPVADGCVSGRDFFEHCADLAPFCSTLFCPSCTLYGLCDTTCGHCSAPHR